MMPELGKYAGAVLSSYAASIALLIFIIAVSIWRARKVKAQLEAVEKGVKKNG